MHEHTRRERVRTGHVLDDLVQSSGPIKGNQGQSRTGHVLDDLVQLASIAARSAKLLGASIFGKSEIALEQLCRGSEDRSRDYLLAGVRERLAERACLRRQWEDIWVRSVCNQCAISVRSVCNQCAISVQSPLRGRAA